METLNANTICCLIITYNPDENLFGLIGTLTDQINKIIIVDNNSQGKSINIIQELSNNSKVHIIRNIQNLGIAKALNQGILFAVELKFKWVLTFDQDSQPFNNVVATIAEVYSFYPEKDLIGAIGINYEDENLNNNHGKFDNAIYRVKDYLITSGCLLSTYAFLKVGGFREDFFIDNVDLEYSLRLSRYDLISLITKKAGMNHKAGQPVKKKFCGLTVVSSNHSRTRRYYMARNHIVLTREYVFRFPYFIAKLNYFFILSLLQILIVDEDKKGKISASFRGLFDGLFYSSKYKKLALNASESGRLLGNLI
jgi:rhamnosyltransferase